MYSNESLMDSACQSWNSASACSIKVHDSNTLRETASMQ